MMRNQNVVVSVTYDELNQGDFDKQGELIKCLINQTASKNKDRPFLIILSTIVID